MTGTELLFSKSCTNLKTFNILSDFETKLISMPNRKELFLQIVLPMFGFFFLTWMVLARTLIISHFKLVSKNVLSIIVCKTDEHYQSSLIFYNGYVYIFGGEYSVTSKIEFLYPFKNSTFTTSQASQYFLNKRRVMGTVLLPNGFIYLIGGSNGTLFNCVSLFIIFESIESSNFIL